MKVIHVYNMRSDTTKLKHSSRFAYELYGDDQFYNHSQFSDSIFTLTDINGGVNYEQLAYRNNRAL
jgi:hypothetical protein